MKIFKYILLLAAEISVCFCQEQGNDSLKVYPMSDVIITATRSAIPLRDSPVSVEVFAAEDVKASNGSNVADLIKNSTGFFINDLGGGASLKTAMIRGTSSQNLLVLVDGIRQNSMQNGIGYLNTEFLSGIDMIEIVYGGNSALYGSDAVGGVVNILSRKQRSNRGAEIGASVGSNGLSSYLFNVEWKIGEIGLSAGYTSERARDDFIYQCENSLLQDPEAVRENADYWKRKWMMTLTAVPHEKSYLRFRGQFYRTEFGVPGSINYPTPHARQSDDDAGIFINYENDNLKDVKLTVGSGFRYTLENYRDPQAFFPFESFYKNLFLNINPQIMVKLNENSRTIIGGEFSEGALASNDFDSRIIRAQKALYISGEQEFRYGRAFFDRFFLFQTIRFDDASDIDHAITPKIGLNIRILREGDLRVRASACQNFRVPTFNDLYFRNFSNPDLKSERSSGFDAGISAAADIWGEHRAAFTYFYQNITDRIIFDLATFAPQNLGRSVSEGFEIRYGCNLLNDLLDLDFNYSFTNVRKMNRDWATDSTYGKRLAYVPVDIINLRIALTLKPVILTIFQNYAGKRYTNADNTGSLPAYVISSANVRTEVDVLGLRLMLKAEVSNIFNKSYQTFEGYPMPGRTVRGTVGLSY